MAMAIAKLPSKDYLYLPFSSNEHGNGAGYPNLNQGATGSTEERRVGATATGVRQPNFQFQVLKFDFSALGAIAIY